MTPSISRAVERRWFWRTVGCTAGLCLGVVTWAISSYLAQKLMQEINATLSASSDLPDLSYMEEKSTPITILAWTTDAIFLVFGLCLLFCFTKWLLAIRRRRVLEAAYFGGLPPPVG